MKSIFACIGGISISLFVSVSAQTEIGQNAIEAARVIGGVSDGRPSPPTPPKEAPQFNIHWSKVHHKDGRKITINRVEAPPITQTKLTVKVELSEEEREAQRAIYEKWLQDATPSGGTFMVEATIFDRRITRVRWWHNGQMSEAWSNVNWNHLCGFSSFEGRGKRYDLFLLPSNASLAQMRQAKELGYEVVIPDIPELPSIAENGASYTITRKVEGDEASLEFIEAIHDLYDAERDKLMRAHRERQRHRVIRERLEDELRKNPPPKPDLIINFWERDVVKERQDAAKAKQKGGQR